MYKAAIFDLDGTLLNTIEDLANACNYALDQCGLPTHEVNKYNRFVGDGRIKLIERIIPEEHMSEELFNRVLNLYDEYYLDHMVDMTKPYDGVCELLGDLKRDGIKLAILSNKPHEFTTTIAEDFFGNTFDLLFGHRKDYKTKPNPESLYQAINELNISQDECIYIGDSNVDIQTAKNAKVKSIGVSWGFRGREELEAEGADFVVDKANEIKDVVFEQNK